MDPSKSHPAYTLSPSSTSTNQPKPSPSSTSTKSESPPEEGVVSGGGGGGGVGAGSDEAVDDVGKLDIKDVQGGSGTGSGSGDVRRFHPAWQGFGKEADGVQKDKGGGQDGKVKSKL
jgi:hypothetical protein